MDLLIENERTAFNLDEIKKRGLIRAQYHSWPEPRNGIVVAAGETVIQVLFLTGINSSACYYKIKAEEVADGKWSIKYTNSMEEFIEIEMTYNVDSECTCSDCTCGKVDFDFTEGDNSDWS